MAEATAVLYSVLDLLEAMLSVLEQNHLLPAGNIVVALEWCFEGCGVCR